MRKRYIPTIDISSLLRGLDSKKSNITIKKIEKACVEIGFFQIINHGISKYEIQSLCNIGNKFFQSSKKFLAKYFKISSYWIKHICLPERDDLLIHLQ